MLFSSVIGCISARNASAIDATAEVFEVMLGESQRSGTIVSCWLCFCMLSLSAKAHVMHWFSGMHCTSGADVLWSHAMQLCEAWELAQMQVQIMSMRPFSCWYGSRWGSWTVLWRADATIHSALFWLSAANQQKSLVGCLTCICSHVWPQHWSLFLTKQDQLHCSGYKMLTWQLYDVHSKLVCASTQHSAVCSPLLNSLLT